MRYDSPAVSMNDVSKAAVPGDAPARNMEFSARRPNRTRRRLIAGAFCVTCRLVPVFSVDYARLRAAAHPCFPCPPQRRSTRRCASLNITGYFIKL